MARNVPDDITAGVMGNSQGNREGVGDTDIDLTSRTTRSTYTGTDRRRADAADWKGLERRRRVIVDAPDFEATKES